MNEQGTTTLDVSIPSAGMYKGTPYHRFKVPPEVFRKFETGRNKFERWSKYLDLNDENQYFIYDTAKRRPQDTIVLQCNETGAMRAIRRRSSNGL